MSPPSKFACAACQAAHRSCQENCVFAPSFPRDQPEKYETVDNVYGRTQVSRILKDLNPSKREVASNCLAYATRAREKDPIYGIVGLIIFLRHKLKKVLDEIHSGNQELAKQGMVPNLTQTEAEQQQQQLVDASSEHEMWCRNFEQYHQLIDRMSNNREFDVVTGPSGQQVNTTGFTHLTGPPQPQLQIQELFLEDVGWGMVLQKLGPEDIDQTMHQQEHGDEDVYWGMLQEDVDQTMHQQEHGDEDVNRGMLQEDVDWRMHPDLEVDCLQDYDIDWSQI
ncbi:LOB domain-containing protein 36-like protein [Tanacetum coccineum]|uniref:LOB domain-containing protein 36-like protein n=1 Tax=Tanacetum coccineum TaxID=301880 RepID=A0ABQ5AVM6_9ASTR